MGEPGHRGRHKMRPMGAKTTASKITASAEIGPDFEGAPDPAEALAAVRAMVEDSIPAEPKSWTPDQDDMLVLKGKYYLPARRRIQWLRGEPVAHPDWTIDTEIEEHERGRRTGPGRVESGYAVVRANLYNETGRLIATGLKSEYSENFPDYLEKAETGAIARALAVAGFGTESALDLDEGVDKERIADSPVAPKLGASAVPGVGRGGRTEAASVAQIRRVSELSKELDLGPVGLIGVIENVLGDSFPDITGTDDESTINRMIATFLSEQSAQKVGDLIASLEAATEK